MQFRNALSRQRLPQREVNSDSVSAAEAAPVPEELLQRSNVRVVRVGVVFQGGKISISTQV